MKKTETYLYQISYILNMEAIEGIYKEGAIMPIGNVKLKNNTKVIITIPEQKPASKKHVKSLEGIGKQLVSDEELESFLEQAKKSLAKVM